VPNAAIGRKCVPFKLEMVVRGHLVGHAWRTYSSGKRVLCGVSMPEGLKENDPFPAPIITPATKAEEGHDEDISREEILEKGLATEKDWEILSRYALQLFERGKAIAAKHGLILADTKYEFGKIGDTIYLMDEIHTPDSSRYFYADGFEERQKNGERQKQLSKEFVREWLIANNFMGKEGQTVPEMSEEWVKTISERYIELFEKVTGETFQPEPLSREETIQRITSALHHLNI
jgi:phosphoribosylaminoimidazole-succinocarboxamide synthase